MSTVKRVSGEYTIQSIGASDPINLISSSVNIDGNLTVTGNAVLVGNINADKIFNGTTSIEIPVTNGNANVTVGGTANVAVFATTGAFVTGLVSVTGNVQGGNLRTAGQVSAAGDVTGSNISVAGNVLISRDASVGQPTIRFTDTDTTVTDGQVLGAVEWFTNDAIPGARVTAGIRAIAAGVLGNANIQILTSTNGAAATAKFVVDNVGNVGIANAAPLDTLAVSGTMYGSSTLTAVGTITGGNLSTAGFVTATGNVTGANIVAAQGMFTGNVSATANIVSANIQITGNSYGTGIGVENIVWQPTTVAFNSGIQANVGVLGFLVLGGYSYKYEAYLPILPDNNTTTGFSTYFDAGTCYYTVEAQIDQTSAFTTSTSNVSATVVATQAMTGTTPRTARITGTIYSAGNANVAIQAETSAANINIQSGAYLTYTRLS